MPACGFRASECHNILQGSISRLLSAGKCAVRRLKRAQIRLAAEAGATDEEIARTIGVAGSTVYRTKRRFVVAGLEAALSEQPRPGAERKLTGKSTWRTELATDVPACHPQRNLSFCPL